MGFGFGLGLGIKAYVGRRGVERSDRQHCFLDTTPYAKQSASLFLKHVVQRLWDEDSSLTRAFHGLNAGHLGDSII